MYNETNVGTPLPLILTSLNAKTITTGNQINWGIANVINVKAITIERSGADKNFSPLATLPTTTSQFIDINPLAGDNYYRLITTDSDGSTKTYPQIAVVKGLNSEITFYPNPVSNGVLNVVAGNQAIKSVALINLSGVKVVSIPKVSNSKTVVISTQSLAKGVYLLEIKNTESTSIKKIVVN